MHKTRAVHIQVSTQPGTKGTAAPARSATHTLDVILGRSTPPQRWQRRGLEQHTRTISGRGLLEDDWYSSQTRLNALGFLHEHPATLK